jgi:hypothetical protein
LTGLPLFLAALRRELSAKQPLSWELTGLSSWQPCCLGHFTVTLRMLQLYRGPLQPQWKTCSSHDHSRQPALALEGSNLNQTSCGELYRALHTLQLFSSGQRRSTSPGGSAEGLWLVQTQTQSLICMKGCLVIGANTFATTCSCLYLPDHLTFFFFVVLGLELRAYTLSHSTCPFL